MSEGLGPTPLLSGAGRDASAPRADFLNGPGLSPPALKFLLLSSARLGHSARTSDTANG